ncbi:MAG: hypothetical protein JSW73_00670 [Candidatus Woesearchaeota archaeon]|nr:MAG: hypothetical protein JSW73_00670 [Candidatus Woesearchaeota archaeon]
MTKNIALLDIYATREAFYEQSDIDEKSQLPVPMGLFPLTLSNSNYRSLKKTGHTSKDIKELELDSELEKILMDSNIVGILQKGNHDYLLDKNGIEYIDLYRITDFSKEEKS